MPEQLTLNDGATIPRIGLGVWQVDPDITAKVVRWGIEAGYRLIDTAEGYRNEEGVGEAIRSAGVPRKELFITSKLRNGAHRRDDALRAFDDTMAKLGIDRVQAGRFGACLMREPALVADSVAAMIAAVPGVPVTVKCRLGVDDDHEWERFVHFIDTIAEAGCRSFIVHARNAWLQGLSPKENREVPPLRYDWAYRLKRERPGLQVVVNGGIADAAEATAHLAHVDGAMLGRAAYHTPYLLHALDVRWFGGELRSRSELLRAYRPYAEAQLARGVFLKHITRHLLGLFAGQPGGRAFRQVLSEGAHKPGADWALVEQALALTERAQAA